MSSGREPDPFYADGGCVYYRAFDGPLEIAKSKVWARNMATAMNHWSKFERQTVGDQP